VIEIVDADRQLDEMQRHAPRLVRRRPAAQA